MKRATYVPERGDLVWLDFTPHGGREHAGRRPAPVVSPAAYNGEVELALLCPVTSQMKGYPFEVALPASGGIGGVVLADQVESLDWRVRHAAFAARAPAAVMEQVLGKLATLVQVP